MLDFNGVDQQLKTVRKSENTQASQQGRSPATSLTDKPLAYVKSALNFGRLAVLQLQQEVKLEGREKKDSEMRELVRQIIEAEKGN
jgi:hypothetical protein